MAEAKPTRDKAGSSTLRKQMPGDDARSLLAPHETKRHADLQKAENMAKNQSIFWLDSTGLDVHLQSMRLSPKIHRHSKPVQKTPSSCGSGAVVRRAGGVSPLFRGMRHGVGDSGWGGDSGLTSAARRRPQALSAGAASRGMPCVSYGGFINQSVGF
ncbi:MAG: hypothetical protein RKP20_08680, partial [Candidatus Competibacter sp.]|nr:hypothetical protein [Candidatus Competibacter sp.]